jgi:hypothetical protein
LGLRGSAVPGRLQCISHAVPGLPGQRTFALSVAPVRQRIIGPRSDEALHAVETLW